ncbi:MAG: MORN repeat-containing protein [Bacteroidia bacterium]
MKLHKQYIVGFIFTLMLIGLLASMVQIDTHKKSLQRMNSDKLLARHQQDSLTKILEYYFHKSAADEHFIEQLIQTVTLNKGDSIVLQHARLSALFPDLEKERLSQAAQVTSWRTTQRNQLNALIQNHHKLQAEYNKIYAQNDSSIGMVQLLSDSVIGFKKNLLLLYSQLSELDSIHKINLNILEIEQNGQVVYYVGEKHNGLAHGFGVGLWSTGGIYKGYWQHNLRHGQGWYRWKDGELYEGFFKEGMRTGVGTYYWKDKSYYQGEWLDNYRHGFGSVYYPDGTLQYEGMWSMDRFIQKEKN